MESRVRKGRERHALDKGTLGTNCLGVGRNGQYSEPHFLQLCPLSHGFSQPLWLHLSFFSSPLPSCVRWFVAMCFP